MLYVQFDAEASVASRLTPPDGTVLALRARRLGDVLDGLALRQSEPAILALRYLVQPDLVGRVVQQRLARLRGERLICAIRPRHHHAVRLWQRHQGFSLSGARLFTSKSPGGCR